MRPVALVALVVALGRAAAADPPPPPNPNRVEVQVGKTVEQDVGYARGGWFCDDTTLITADLVTRGDTNFWIVTGVKAGSTQCRVGNDLHRAAIVFDVIVTAPPPKPKKKAP